MSHDLRDEYAVDYLRALLSLSEPEFDDFLEEVLVEVPPTWDLPSASDVVYRACYRVAYALHVLVGRRSSGVGPVRWGINAPTPTLGFAWAWLGFGLPSRTRPTGLIGRFAVRWEPPLTQPWAMNDEAASWRARWFTFESGAGWAVLPLGFAVDWEPRPPKPPSTRPDASDVLGAVAVFVVLFGGMWAPDLLRSVLRWAGLVVAFSVVALGVACEPRYAAECDGYCEGIGYELGGSSRYSSLGCGGRGQPPCPPLRPFVDCICGVPAAWPPPCLGAEVSP